MPEDLPVHLDPWRAVKNGLSFAGEVALSQFPRLATALLGCVEDRQARAVYQLRFERGRDGRDLVVGRILACLRVPCQRCLGGVEIEVDVPLRLALIRTDQMAGELPEDLDPLLVADEQMDLMALIEDELLLAIPMFPRHGDGLCQPLEILGVDVNPEPPDLATNAATLASGHDKSREEPHPFAVLAGIRCNQGDSK
ncbi:hypothetical protein CCR95_11390 [Thiocystis minor]|uniref:YceD family protein n=1 Tax=Thiocystis minor TaxID=61597 RepID=UPI001913C662|nr:YceD family protein [Thiocystis minor]MBK5964667.1 hypothetical protein [Thiocystis minor]